MMEVSNEIRALNAYECTHLMQTRKTRYCHRMQMFWSFWKERDLCRRQLSMSLMHAQYTYTICSRLFALSIAVEQAQSEGGGEAVEKTKRRNQSCQRQIRFQKRRWRRLVFTIYFHTGNPCEREWSFVGSFVSECARTHTPHSSCVCWGFARFIFRHLILFIDQSIVLAWFFSSSHSLFLRVQWFRKWESIKRAWNPIQFSTAAERVSRVHVCILLAPTLIRETFPLSLVFRQQQRTAEAFNGKKDISPYVSDGETPFGWLHKSNNNRKMNLKPKIIQ